MEEAKQIEVVPDMVGVAGNAFTVTLMLTKLVKVPSEICTVNTSLPLYRPLPIRET